MNILDVINSEDFRDKEVSLYLDSETASGLIVELIEKGENIYPDFEALDEEIVILSRNTWNGEVEWYLDALLGIKGQVYNEIEVAVIPSELLDEIDLDRIECDEIVILEQEVGEGDDMEGLLEEMTQDVLDDIEDGECPYYRIKNQLKIMYEIAREEALSDVQDVLDKIN